MIEFNHTHDLSARSWVGSANLPGIDFPIQNLPFAVFHRAGVGEHWRGGVAIGDQIVDLAALSETGLLVGNAEQAAAVCRASSLNALLALGMPAWSGLRHALFGLLKDDAPADKVAVLRECLVPQGEAKFKVPVQVGGYSDFYTSLHHAENLSRALGANFVTPNFKWLPIVYHGRTSTIDISGHRVRRPFGQTRAPDTDAPVYGATRRLDYESELAIYIGQGNAEGEPIRMASAEGKVFGIGLLNDWSARDIQVWEQAPLGPFHAKNFATTVSPWIVTMEALAPYRLPATRPEGDPAPLAYLDSDSNRLAGAIDVVMEVWLGSARQRDDGMPIERVSSTSFRHQYWTVAQMVTHHAANGCSLRVGDILGSGTVSGPEAGEAGALLELAEGGRKPVVLATGEQRSFLEDGDTVTMTAHCAREGFARIGFGQCTGKVQPALAH